MKDEYNKKTEKYKKAYNLLMDYFDSFNKEQKKDIDKELLKLGL